MDITTLRKHLNVAPIAEKVKKAQSILLTTHKQCDGDGLGAILGLYHVLKTSGKDVRVFCVDDIPRKYHFLPGIEDVEIYEKPHPSIEQTDLCLIFDTNDNRLLEPMWGTLKEHCDEILFVDHHPVLTEGPLPTKGSYINTNAASTGEIAFFIIEELGLKLNNEAAKAFYTSICFDTQLFRFVKSLPNSNLIAAHLLQYDISPEEVHKGIFSTYTVGKMQFLSEVLGQIEYFRKDSVAVLLVRDDQLRRHNLDVDDSRDVIDMIMNITSLEAAALFREEKSRLFKMSLRSKGRIEVLSIAEKFDGGGHKFAAGAPIEGEYQELKRKVVNEIILRLDNPQLNIGLQAND